MKLTSEAARGAVRDVGALVESDHVASVRLVRRIVCGEFSHEKGWEEMGKMEGGAVKEAAFIYIY